jgi:hypothetical protein
VETLTEKPLPRSQRRLIGNGIPDPIVFAKSSLHEDFKTFRIREETLADFKLIHLKLIHTYRESYRRVLELRMEDPDLYQELYERRYRGLLGGSSSGSSPSQNTPLRL